MKIFSAKQLKEADNLSIKKQGISSEELMERAGTQVFRVIHQRLEGTNTHVRIFCGVGNNGGDGLVIGRLLIEQGHEVTMDVVNYSDKRSKNFLLNYDRVKNVTKKWPILLTSEDDFPELTDAMLGILYPHYDKPIPSMSIVQMEAPKELPEAHLVPAGTLIDTEPVDGEPCRFRTAFDQAKAATPA